MSHLKYKKHRKINYINIDPTAIIKLHSIIAGADNFYLTQQYNYSTRHHSNLIYSLRLPAEFRDLMKNIRDIKKIAVEWHQSHEVGLYRWSLRQTLQILNDLRELCIQNESILLNLEEVHS